MDKSIEQQSNQESIERPKKKCLLIDDNSPIIEGLNDFFKDYENFNAVECHSVLDAVKAIKANSPDVIFLDHSLTGGGSEGFEIADIAKQLNPKIEIYSTTTNPAAEKAYEQRGIKHIRKGFPEDMEEIMNS